MITRRIARGGMAEIYRAKRRAGAGGPGQWVALKMMRPSLDHEDLREQLFKREARIASAIQHPNVVPLHEFGRELDRYYISMEYLRGRDLSHLSKAEGKNDPIPVELGLYIGQQAAAGLGYAHRLVDPTNGEDLKIVHRDISPGNVMIAYDGAVKVLDFGVARMAESHGLRTQTGTLRGKFAYMSPEQTVGSAIDARSDVFSLGTLLYELLTGTNPFRARTPIATLERVQRVRPVPPSRANRKIPRDLDEILARCLAKDPRRRYKDALELWEALGERVAKTGADQAALSRFMCDRFAWEKGEEAKELKEEEDEVAIIEVVDFALKPDDAGLDAKHVAVSQEEEAESSAVSVRRELPANSDEEERLGVFDADGGDKSGVLRPETPLAPRPDPIPPPRVVSQPEPDAEIEPDPTVHERRAPVPPARAALSAPVALSERDAAESSGATIAQPGFGWGKRAPARRVEASSLLDTPLSVATAVAPKPATGHTDPLLAALQASPGSGSMVVIAPSRTAVGFRWRPSYVALVAAATAAIALVAALLVRSDPPTKLKIADPNAPTKIAPIRIKVEPQEPQVESRPARAEKAREEPLRAPPVELVAAQPKSAPRPEAANRTVIDPVEVLPPHGRRGTAGDDAAQKQAEEKAKAEERAKEEKRKAEERAKAEERKKAEERAKEERRAEARADSRRPKRGGPIGYLNVGAKPWAEIEIDGRAWPYQTPQAGIELPAGRHVIKLSNRETGATKTMVVTIKPGAYKTITADLRTP